MSFSFRFSIRFSFCVLLILDSWGLHTCPPAPQEDRGLILQKTEQWKELMETSVHGGSRAGNKAPPSLPPSPSPPILPIQFLGPNPSSIPTSS